MLLPQAHQLQHQHILVPLQSLDLIRNATEGSNLSWQHADYLRPALHLASSKYRSEGFM